MVMEYPRSEAEEHERLGQKIEAQHRLFQMAIDHAPAGIIILDGRELRAKWVNPAYRQFLEEPYRNREITGMALQDFLPGAEESGLADMLRQVAATGQPYVNPEYEYVGFSRGTTYWRGSVLPLSNEGERIPDVMLLVIEITEEVLARKQVEELARQAEAERAGAEAERARLKAIIDSAPEAIMVIDERCHLLLTNPVADRLYVRSAPYGEDFRNNPGIGVYYPDGTRYHPWDLPLARTARDGETRTDVEVGVPRPDGGRCDLLVNTAPIRDGQGQVSGAVGIFQDITRMKQAERERQRLLEQVKGYAGKLQKANEELQSQAGELLAQKEELAEADRRKDEFLAMLSHELRNPLGAIGNVAEVLRLRGTSDPTCEEIHAVLQRQVQHMTRLLDDLLDVARIAHGKIELRKKPVDLVTAMAQAVETARPLIEARSHELQISLPARPVWLEADPTRLEQILTNLLNNAAKYTEPGGRIGLTAEREGKQAVLRVWDTGVGIAPELLPRIFNPFMQGDGSPGRSLGGLGVGLTLVRRLVEMHGGSVEACSAGPGQGSEFVVCLPISDFGLPAVELPYLPSEVADPPTKRVLVVDDNVDTAKMLALALRMWGHQVEVVHDGPAAIEAAIGYRPEVVLIDIGMPGMDGYEVARRLRRQAGLSDAMLVALTGYGHEEAQRRSRESGFDQHLVKPVGAARLQELLVVAPKGSRPNGKGVQREEVTVV